jgi:hypothetical protein
MTAVLLPETTAVIDRRHNDRFAGSIAMYPVDNQPIQQLTGNNSIFGRTAADVLTLPFTSGAHADNQIQKPNE